MLKLKLGCPVLVMANFDFKAGLCKGELPMVIALGDRTITIELLDPPDSTHTTFVLSRIIFDFQPLDLPIK